MNKKIISLFFLLFLPIFIFAQGPPKERVPVSVVERVQERTETIRTKEEVKIMEKESTLDKVRSRVSERIPDEGKEMIVGIIENLNRTNKNYVNGFLQGLESISMPFDRIKDMVNTVENNLELDLEKTQEKIDETENKIDEVLDEAAEYYQTNYMPGEETEIISEMRKMIQNINRNRNRLQEARREIMQMVREVMNMFVKEMREHMSNNDNDNDNNNDNDDNGSDSPIILD